MLRKNTKVNHYQYLPPQQYQQTREVKNYFPRVGILYSIILTLKRGEKKRKSYCNVNEKSLKMLERKKKMIKRKTGRRKRKRKTVCKRKCIKPAARRLEYCSGG